MCIIGYILAICPPIYNGVHFFIKCLFLSLQFLKKKLNIIKFQLSLIVIKLMRLDVMKLVQKAFQTRYYIFYCVLVFR